MLEFAIEKIKEWNPYWKPMYAMVDCCREEINAIEITFPECKVFICDFHREQAWDRWLNKTDNGARMIKNEMLCKFRHIASASTECTE